MALNVMEKVIRILLYWQHLSPASSAERNHLGMQFSKRDFLIGEIGEILVINFWLSEYHTQDFLILHIHHFVTSLFVTPEFLKGF
jgi:hypothetical protein